MHDPHLAAPHRQAAALDLSACLACGQACEITGSFRMPGAGEPERYVRTRCVLGHLMVGPEFALRVTAA